jgi:hypothetical protein
LREVSNEAEYKTENIARTDYEMPEKDRLGTQLFSKQPAYSSTMISQKKRATDESLA